MLLLNYDFYDIHAVLLFFRMNPSNISNIDIAKAIKAVIDAPQTENTIDSNIIRHTLAQIDDINNGPLAWACTK